MFAIVRQSRFLIPLAIFVVMAGFLSVGLKLDSTLVPTPYMDKQAPDFTLPQLHAESETFSPGDMQGKVWLLNVWASWCVACDIEHEDLVRLAHSGYTIIGLNYKDEPLAARRWLRDRGDPYVLTAVDQSGNAGIDWGVYGVPETFIVDQSGKIRFKHIGPIDDEVVNGEIIPLIKELES